MGVTGNGGIVVYCLTFLLFSLSFHCLLSSIDTELLYVLIMWSSQYLLGKVNFNHCVDHLTMKMYVGVRHSSMH